MYDRRLDDQVLTLAVSGILWRESLVMIDSETRSLWSQLLGQAQEGPLKDRVLTPIPSVITDWRAWKQMHPDTTALVMSRTDSHFKNTQLAKYEMPRLVIGLRHGDEARCWPFDRLARNSIVNDELNNRPLVVFFDKQTTTAFVYDRSISGRTLQFQWQELAIIDRQTQSHWDLRRGTALSGPLEGTQLKALPAIPSYGEDWENFHPRGSVWGR